MFLSWYLSRIFFSFFLESKHLSLIFYFKAIASYCTFLSLIYAACLNQKESIKKKKTNSILFGRHCFAWNRFFSFFTIHLSRYRKYWWTFLALIWCCHQFRKLFRKKKYFRDDCELRGLRLLVLKNKIRFIFNFLCSW